jgi:hypothetical protein
MTIFAAQDFEGEPVARVRLDHHVPIGFHGNWISDAALLAPTMPERSASPGIPVAAREMART